ncbi:MAG: aminopeptidase P family protein [Clostridia bacterium]|nr:aminopeptidase P family protein [Clostridia bacterium]
MLNRIEALRSRFDDLKIDACLITSAVSHRYFATFDNPDALLLITRESAYAFEDFRYVEKARATIGMYYSLLDTYQATDAINDIIHKESIKSIGIEDTRLSHFLYKRYEEKLNTSLAPIGDTIEQMREIKSPKELEKIAIAQEITDGAFAHILRTITPTMTENNVAAELEYYMRKHGAEDKSFETIAISGEKTSMPHGTPSDTRLKKGFLTMDFGALYDGYHSDMTRTICIGKADEEMKKLYNTVLKAQKSALEMLRDGVKCSDADKVARDIIDVDYKGTFGHSLGHGVGLEIHERPNLSQRNDKILVPSNVVTVEPGIYISGKYGCRIEDLVIIKEGEIRNLTKSPKELIEIY